MVKKCGKILFLFFLVFWVVGILPPCLADAQEKEYKLSLTGEVDLCDADKVIYDYDKMMKNVTLTKVEGKNSWNLTMYAGTTVDLPMKLAGKNTTVKYTTSSKHLRGGTDLYNYYSASKGYKETYKGKCIFICAWDIEATKIVENQKITVKAYNTAGKCISTLNLTVKILPYNGKLERTKPVSPKTLYKLNYARQNYSDMVWKQVIQKCPEQLTKQDNIDASYMLWLHLSELETYEKQIPAYLLTADEFGDYAFESWEYDHERLLKSIDGLPYQAIKEILDDKNRVWELYDYEERLRTAFAKSLAREIETCSTFRETYEWCKKIYRYSSDMYGTYQYNYEYGKLFSEKELENAIYEKTFQLVGKAECKNLPKEAKKYATYVISYLADEVKEQYWKEMMGYILERSDSLTNQEYLKLILSMEDWFISVDMREWTFPVIGAHLTKKMENLSYKEFAKMLSGLPQSAFLSYSNEFFPEFHGMFIRKIDTLPYKEFSEMVSEISEGKIFWNTGEVFQKVQTAVVERLLREDLSRWGLWQLTYQEFIDMYHSIGTENDLFLKMLKEKGTAHSDGKYFEYDQIPGIEAVFDSITTEKICCLHYAPFEYNYEDLVSGITWKDRAEAFLDHGGVCGILSPTYEYFIRNVLGEHDWKYVLYSNKEVNHEVLVVKTEDGRCFQVDNAGVDYWWLGLRAEPDYAKLGTYVEDAEWKTAFAKWQEELKGIENLSWFDFNVSCHWNGKEWAVRPVWYDYAKNTWEMYLGSSMPLCMKYTYTGLPGKIISMAGHAQLDGYIDLDELEFE